MSSKFGFAAHLSHTAVFDLYRCTVSVGIMTHAQGVIMYTCCSVVRAHYVYLAHTCCVSEIRSVKKTQQKMPNDVASVHLIKQPAAARLVFVHMTAVFDNHVTAVFDNHVTAVFDNL